jgi:glycosyltransferase involved in cell wall biosynthesis
MYGKDVGFIPATLATTFGWDARLLVAERSFVTNPSGAPRPPGFTMRSVGPNRSRVATVARLGAALATERLDAALVYHLTSDSLALATLIKLRSPRATIALKLDVDERALDVLTAPTRSRRLAALEAALRASPVDFVTVETRAAAARLEAVAHDRWRKPIVLVPNGIRPPSAAPTERQPWILTTGRLGMPQKNTEAIVDALVLLGPQRLGPWKLILAGTYTDELRASLDALFARHPWLAERIERRDWVSDPRAMSELYEQSSVYCLASRWESFGLVIPEALAHGCYVISTRVGVAPEVMSDSSCGELLARSDADSVARALARVMDGAVDLTGARAHARERASSYGWPSVLAPLDAELRQRLPGRVASRPAP